MRRDFARYRSHPLLMHIVGIAVKQSDSQRFNTLTQQGFEVSANGVLVKRV